MMMAKLKPGLCTKVCYPTWKKATAALEFYSSERQRALAHGKKVSNKKLKRVYECDVCNGWHLTSQKPQSERDTLKLRRLMPKLTATEGA